VACLPGTINYSLENTKNPFAKKQKGSAVLNRIYEIDWSWELLSNFYKNSNFSYLVSNTA
jgi:hypothetical protein